MISGSVFEELRENLAGNRPRQFRTLFDLPYGQIPNGENYCVLGVPYDAGTAKRPGCRFGPRLIREAYGAQRLAYEQDNAYKADNLCGVDLGDVGVVQGYAQESMQLVYEAVARVLNNGAVPVVLGGDHVVRYPELKAYSERYGKIAMICFDAHETVWEHEGQAHGTLLQNAIEDGILDCAHSIQVGLRGSDARCLTRARECGMDMVTMQELRRVGVEGCCRRIRERIGGTKAFVAFDIDFLDPVYAPGTGAPVPGGVSSYEACEILRGLLGLQLVGFDLTEVSAVRDPAGITAMAAVAIVKQFLILLSKQKKHSKEEQL